LNGCESAWNKPLHADPGAGVQAGVDLPTVKRISGHKTRTMVERYAHQPGAHIQAAMDRLQRRDDGR
jgi:hypothetical protein